jgi:predicted nucleic acid-binding Zn ribbon protein
MSNYMDLGEAIRAFLAKHGLQDEADIQQVIAEWETLMGKPIAQATEKMWFNKGIFYIKIKSPVWKNELQMARIKIRTLLNEKIGRELIEEVRIF